MKTNKKIVRLTESKLHNIITESVSQILNELDPRTYASAAEKARRRSLGYDHDYRYKRAEKFKKAAANAWDRDYGKEVGESHFVDVRDYDGSESLGNGGVFVTNDYLDGTGDCFRPSPCWDDEKYNERQPWRRNIGNGRWSYDNARSKGEKVATQMVRGDGKYIKGKGWQ